MLWQKILHYLNPATMFRSPEKKPSLNLRFMHGINRISIFMFLLGLIILIIKYIRG